MIDDIPRHRLDEAISAGVILDAASFPGWSSGLAVSSAGRRSLR
jgi:hypothetical protein